MVDMELQGRSTNIIRITVEKDSPTAAVIYESLLVAACFDVVEGSIQPHSAVHR